MAVAPPCHAAPARSAAALFTGGRPAALAAVTLALLFFTCPAAARTWVVRPGGSIQGAIDRAGSGDVILILPGEYREHIEITGKTLALRSVRGPAATTIVLLNAPGESGSVGMQANSGSDGTSLEGFTFTSDPTSPPLSPAIRFDADLVVRRCTFADLADVVLQSGPAVAPSLDLSGTTFVHCDLAVDAAASTVDVSDCSFLRGRAGLTIGNCRGDGVLTMRHARFEDIESGVDLRGSSGLVEECLFARCGQPIQATVACATDLTVRNSRFVGSGPSAAIEAWGPLTVEDCLFTGGRGVRGAAIDATGPSPTAIRRSDFDNNDGTFIVGAIGAPLELIDCTWTDNTSTVPYGLILALGHASSPGPITIRGCRLADNVAERAILAVRAPGAAVVISDTLFARNLGRGTELAVDPDTSVITGCRFVENTGSDEDLLAGPAIPITGCTFERNRFDYRLASASSMDNCRFLGNQADSGLVTARSMSNCIFVGNAGWVGLDRGEIIGCTFDEHTGPQMRVGARSCIFRHLDASITFTRPVRYSNVDGGFSGPGNINADPLFVRDPSPGPDQAWGTPDDDYGDLRLQPGSPCIDAADSTAFDDDVATDLAGAPRFVDDPATPDTGVPDDSPPRAVADMGAFEFQPNTAPPPPVCDLNGDGRVTVHDLLTYLGQWTSSDPAADLDGNGEVNVLDLLEFLDCFTTIH